MRKQIFALILTNETRTITRISSWMIVSPKRTWTSCKHVVKLDPIKCDWCVWVKHAFQSTYFFFYVFFHQHHTQRKRNEFNAPDKIYRQAKVNWSLKNESHANGFCCRWILSDSCHWCSRQNNNFWHKRFTVVNSMQEHYNGLNFT